MLYYVHDKTTFKNLVVTCKTIGKWTSGIVFTHCLVLMQRNQYGGTPYKAFFSGTVLLCIRVILQKREILAYAFIQHWTYLENSSKIVSVHCIIWHL
jgi:hypothetical protein